MRRKKIIQTVSLGDKNDRIITIDQTRLPGEEKIIELKTQEEIRNAIYKLKVRGAPAIGVCAAYGIYLGTAESDAQDAEDLYEDFGEKKNYLLSARPTAVSLSQALERMDEAFRKNMDKSTAEIKQALLEEADRIKEEDIETCRRIGENALMLIGDGSAILTHCNAGRFAAVKYGTALAGIYMAAEREYEIKVFADETRPLLQGSRLTAYELMEAGIDVTLICDSAAAAVMRTGKVDMIFTGADRIAANGDTANKIGTAGIAIIAKYYDIPVYVCAPLSTVDMNCRTGNDIVIEERPASEVTMKWFERPMAPERAAVYNPAFDITNRENISAIITECGIARPPFAESIKALLKKRREEK